MNNFGGIQSVNSSWTMNRPIVFLILLAVLLGGSCLYYMDQLNELTRLRLKIPQHVKELRILNEENQRLQYEINQFESPLYLMELLKKPEFSHLKFPKENEIIVIEEGL